MKWQVVDEDFLDFLRMNEERIPYTKYGSDQYKPFFGYLFEVEDFVYVTQVSSPKPRHTNMKQSLDFYKIYHPADDRLLSVVNLNYMFPVPQKYITELEYRNIEEYRNFKNEKVKSKYIDLLKTKIIVIDKLELDEKSKIVYQLKCDRPTDFISKRCFDYKALEKLCLNYNPILMNN